MSDWTHVAAIVRIDSLRFDDNEVDDFEKIFGKQLLWESTREEWDDATDHPEKYLPMGSEGSLEMSVWTNPDKNCMAAYTVSIFGDLRDHCNPDAIVDWFKSKVEDGNIFIRQAVITVDSGYFGQRTWTYEEEDE